MLRVAARAQENDHVVEMWVNVDVDGCGHYKRLSLVQQLEPLTVYVKLDEKGMDVWEVNGLRVMVGTPARLERGRGETIEHASGLGQPRVESTYEVVSLADGRKMQSNT